MLAAPSYFWAAVHHLFTGVLNKGLLKLGFLSFLWCNSKSNYFLIIFLSWILLNPSQFWALVLSAPILVLGRAVLARVMLWDEWRKELHHLTLALNALFV